ncbi:hypothetical protein BJ994_001492 [Arthrobacter pigmenti]|uniref:GerMN domain-containing protein n=1 Tax=Arthrobacter pigmenti TaxID=271432 RepID=A0A846RTN3_9MICC|nr:GerMN domain-containing protein [Arthrobacter pigmenti]NJC22416.1 hypothetical protein [Arthrobacter pigmenti]
MKPSRFPPARRRGYAWRCAAFLAVLVSLQACTADEEPASAPQAASEADLLLESATSRLPDVELPSTAPAESAPLVPVYWLGEQDQLLYREFLPGESTGDPIAAAIWAMTSTEPLDDDYYSPWQTATAVNTSISPDNVITVDMTSDAFGSDLEPEVASNAIQQLVYTATAAAANAGLIASGSPSSVRLLVDGKAGYEAFGEIELGTELRRNVEAMAPVWIINPQDSSIRNDPTIIVQGSTTQTGSELGWRIRRVDGGGSPAEEVLSGTVAVDAGAGSTGQYEFSASLDPGTYLVEVYVPSEGEPTESGSADNKLFSIR